MKESIGNHIARILSADAQSFRVRVRFDDDFEGEVNLNHIFVKPKGLAAEVLKGGIFEQCFVESGALAWPNGLDLCADAIRRWIDEQADHQAA